MSLLSATSKKDRPIYFGFGWPLLGIALLAGCATQTAQQQLNSRVESQITTIDDLKSQIADLKKENRELRASTQSTEERLKQERADMQVMADDLRSEIQSLRGQHEELKHLVDMLKVDVQKQHSEVQKIAMDASARPESDVAVYEKTLKLITEQKDYHLAIAKFREFLDRFPKSSLADNAAYWVGEAFYAQGKFKEAIVEFQTVIDGYPKGDKLCAALVKQGLSFEQLKQEEQAKLFFEETRANCADLLEAKQAKDGLERLKPVANKTTSPAKKKKEKSR